MPHAVCWKADPRLIWTMVVANAITFLSYTSICITLLFLVRRTRRVIARDWAWFVVGFALFIVACGSTHLMEVVTTWLPFFWVDALSNVLTAVLSACVAIMLIRRVGTIGFGINDYAGRLADSEREKCRMRESLTAAQKLNEWSQMSASVAHEIANPLETIQNLLYLIRHSENASAPVTQLASAAAKEAENVLTIAQSTLAFFRQGTEPELIDLRAAADSVGILLASTMRKKGLALRIEAEGDPVIEALPGEPRQVLLNLVRNACEATTQRGAPVRILLNGRPSGVEMVVADQGSGVDPAILADPYRFGVSTKGARGNGIGLWTVNRIVTRHGGNIRIESEAGRGTSFTLWWPRKFAFPGTGSAVQDASA